MAQRQQYEIKLDSVVERVFRFYVGHLTRCIESADAKEWEELNTSFIDNMLSSGEFVKPPGLSNGVNKAILAEIKIFLDLTETYHEILLFRRRFDTFCRIGAKQEKVSNIKLAISVFIGELYMLRERIKKYSNTLKDRKIEIEKNKISEICRNTLNLYEGKFDKLLKKRNMHVHGFRFEDPELNRLSAMSLILSSQNFEFFETIYLEKFSEVRGYWRSEILDSGKLVSSLVIQYLTKLLPFIIAGEETQDGLDP